MSRPTIFLQGSSRAELFSTRTIIPALERSRHVVMLHRMDSLRMRAQGQDPGSESEWMESMRKYITMAFLSLFVQRMMRISSPYSLASFDEEAWRAARQRQAHQANQLQLVQVVKSGMHGSLRNMTAW